MSSKLFNAIFKEKIKEALYLMDYEHVRRDINSQYGDMNETCLYLACDKCYLNVVKKLLSIEGIDVNKSNKFKYTPLHAATNRQNLAIVKLLLNKGAKLKGDWGGNTPLHSASYSGNSTILECLLQKFWKNINDKRIGRFSSGDTALHSAVDKGQLSTAIVLVNWGADISIKNNNGLTAYALAKRRNYKDIMIFLKPEKGLKYERSLAGSKLSIASQGKRRKLRKSDAIAPLTQRSLARLPALTNSNVNMVVNNGWIDTYSPRHLAFDNNISPRGVLSPLPQIFTNGNPQENIGTWTKPEVPNIIIHNSISGDPEDQYDCNETQRTYSSLSSHSSVFDNNQEVLTKLSNLEDKLDKYNHMGERIKRMETRLGIIETHLDSPRDDECSYRPTEKSQFLTRGDDNATMLREVIRRNFEYLEDNLIASEHLYFLYSKFALTENDLEIIENKAGEKQKIRAMLIILLKKKNYKWVFAFKVSLERSDESQHVLHIFSHLL